MNCKKIITRYALLLSMISACLITGCQPDEFEDSNGLLSADVQASFTVAPVDGRVNTYTLKANPTGVIGVQWDRGDGSGSMPGKTIDSVFYPDAGKYTITLKAIGAGGKTVATTQELVVANSDPNSGNLVVGGKMDPGDEAKWTKLTISQPAIEFSFTNGKLVAKGGSWGHAGVYQAIQVVAGKKYKFDMSVSGSGATDTWFEVFFGKIQPTQNQDYSNGGVRLGLNTWAGCGNTPFNNKIATMACSGSLAGKNGIVEFSETGTIYLVIKTGGANLGTDGISIDNVELRGTK